MSDPRRVKTRYPGILKDTRTGHYVVRIRDRHGRQRSKTFETLTEAQDWKASERVDPSSRSTRSTVTFNEYAEKIPSDHPEWRTGTVAAWNERRRRLNAPEVGFGSLRLTAITAGDVRRALAVLHSKGLAESTIAATRGLITSTYRHAIADEIVNSNPVDRLPARKHSDRSASARHSSLTAEQVAALIEHLPPRLRAMAALLASTGIRPGEAAGVTADRVDLLHGTLTIDRQVVADEKGRPVFGPPKTASSVRVIDLPDALVTLLGEHLATFGTGSGGLLFVSPRLGLPLTGKRRGEIWRTAADGLGFPDAVRGWHALRHTYATTALSSGTPINVVSSALGHANSGVTLEIYAHDARDARRESRNVVADALLPAVSLN